MRTRVGNRFVHLTLRRNDRNEDGTAATVVSSPVRVLESQGQESTIGVEPFALRGV